MSNTVLITGGARGIGKGIAVEFARVGYNVVINYFHSKKEALALQEILGESCLALQADVRDFSAVDAMVKEALKRFGKIDVLVNNAGIAQQKYFLDITTEEFKNMLDVNVTGTFNVTKCVLPNMLRAKSGKIINISSVYGISGGACEVHYSASKGAVISFTKGLAKEIGSSNVQVNCIAPGAVKTDMLNYLSDDDVAQICAETPLQRLGTPRDIGKTAVFLASEGGDFITGQVISPNGGVLI